LNGLRNLNFTRTAVLLTAPGSRLSPKRIVTTTIAHERYTPDYRWLLDRDDSPWYPTVRLFRQGEDRAYTDVIERVRNELLTLIAQQQARLSS